MPWWLVIVVLNIISTGCFVKNNKRETFSQTQTVNQITLCFKRELIIITNSFTSTHCGKDNKKTMHTTTFACIAQMYTWVY